MTILKIIFWLSLFIILYTYFLYGLLLWIYLFIFGRQENKKQHTAEWPNVSILVACYNEEDFVQMKIDNLLSLDYPGDKLELVFVTDGSQDDTVVIIKDNINDGKPIRLYHQAERKGKQDAVNRVIPLLNGEIVVFNDCNTIINEEALKKMTYHFADPNVGVVSGEKKIIVHKEDVAASSGEGLYWRYESFLKKLDSDFYSTIGAAGELYAIRKSLYGEVPQHISIEDFYLSMSIAANGYKNVYEPKACAEEYASLNLSEEMKRKRRIACGAFNTVFSLKSVYRFSNIKLLFLYFSHRILRWVFAPLCLILLFFSSWFLEGPFYTSLFYLQCLFYSLAVIGWLFSGRRTRLTFLHIPLYFSFMNLALILGFFDFLKKDNKVVWAKAERRK